MSGNRKSYLDYCKDIYFSQKNNQELDSDYVKNWLESTYHIMDGKYSGISIYCLSRLSVDISKKWIEKWYATSLDESVNDIRHYINMMIGLSKIKETIPTWWKVKFFEKNIGLLCNFNKTNLVELLYYVGRTINYYDKKWLNEWFKLTLEMDFTFGEMISSLKSLYYHRIEYVIPHGWIDKINNIDIESCTNSQDIIYIIDSMFHLNYRMNDNRLRILFDILYDRFEDISTCENNILHILGFLNKSKYLISKDLLLKINNIICKTKDSRISNKYKIYLSVINN